MIRIDKGIAPVELKKKEAALVKKLIKLYDEDKADYESAIKKFKFTEDYRMDVVKTALIKCQHNKCCFSEAKFTRDYSNVEHFRPKGRIDPYPKGKSEYPGYYWLAYSWDNLFLCKSAINSSNKRNYFPLMKGSPRNRNHNDKEIELPFLIDVTKEDPRDFIRFHNDEPFGLDERGKFNVDFFQLRHPELEEARRTRFKCLMVIKDAVDKGIKAGIDKKEFEEQIDVLRKSMNPEEVFSSMAIDFLQGWRHF